PALGVRRPDVTEGGDEHDVRVRGIDHDARYLTHVAQPREPPGLPGIGRKEYTSSVHDVVAGIALAGADPDEIRVGRRQRDGTDRCGGLILEDRIPGVTAVGRFPDAATAGADVVDVRLAGNAHDRRHPP